MRKFNIFLWAAFAVLYPLLVMGPTGSYVEDRLSRFRFFSLTNTVWRVALFGLIALAGVWLLQKGWKRAGWVEAWMVTALVYGVAYKVATFIPDVSTYPLSLGWSEAGRYYYASLFFSQRVYGIWAPPSVLHPSRYLMQAVPFLIPGSPLWLHRLWQVILWIGMTAGTAALLARRTTNLTPSAPPSLVGKGDGGIGQRSVFILWAFLFLFQGPVYYHLLAMVILVLWGFVRDRFWRSLVVVLVASVWAGISRINWLPVPGLLAATLYLLETAAKGKPFWRYWLPPVVWVGLGTVAGFLSQTAYRTWSGNPSEQFGSSFTSDLLWYRLLPNATYRLGILANVALVSAPIGLLILIVLIKRWRDYHPLRWLGLGAILLALFAGGIVVSVKIGGGSNLHNLDAYLALLMVVGSYFFFGGFAEDLTSSGLPPLSGLGEDRQRSVPKFLTLFPHPQPLSRRERGRGEGQSGRNHQDLSHLPAPEPRSGKGNGGEKPGQGIPLLAILPPLLLAITAGGPLPSYNWAQAEAAIQTLREMTAQAVQDGGEVLFITERQLLTFHTLENVPLSPDYENIFLMEMAMANNRPYLNAFRNDLQRHRFALIVTGPVTIQYQGRSHQFGEENDAWTQRVSVPLLCYYASEVTLQEVNVQILAPRSKTGDCP